MVINADEIDLSGLFAALIALVVAVLVAGVLIGVIAGRFGGRRFGLASFVLGQIAAIALVVDVVVAVRILSGEVTAWDLVWAVGVTLVGIWSLRRLTSPASGVSRRTRTR